MRLLFKNIKELVQVREESISFLAGKEMDVLPTIQEAFLLVEDGIIAGYGPMSECPNTFDEVINAAGKMILPTWCDSHTHLVFAGNRENEFIDRIKGLSYEEIANKGGGILNSAKKLQATSFEDLYHQSKTRLEEIIALGTGAVEIKSGYGLTPEAELKMLRVIKKLKVNYALPIKATFLAAHALPLNFKNNADGFIEAMLTETLPSIAAANLAEYIDVFCEEGYFSVAQTERILAATTKYGLKAKIHVNQFNAIGGVQVGVKYQALSGDHLEIMRQEDIEALHTAKGTIAVALPACSFFLGIPYTPARKLIDSGLSLALASDYNPGSAPSGNMNFVVSTACIKMNMTAKEAINAATINGAYAMGLEKEVGSITKGKKANLIVTKPIPSYGFLPYSFGENHIEEIYINGKKWDTTLNQKKINIAANYSDRYVLPSNENWKGRKSESGKEYWHEVVHLKDINQLDFSEKSVALIGYACDEGVRRNLGREGTKNAPKAIREQLSKLAFHHKEKIISDVGDIFCTDNRLEYTQEKLSESIQFLLKKNIFPIVLGGGHDVAFPHVESILKASNKKLKIGIINFDAHFDLRPVGSSPNSGTPFYQLFQKYREYVSYCVLGIQKASNPQSLFSIAEEENALFFSNFECTLSNFESITQQLFSFLEEHDKLYITIDMDGFSSAFAPGVSAPSPLGFAPDFVIKMLHYFFSTGKVISCDIAELNPSHDIDNTTAKLAARLVDFIVGFRETSQV